MRAEVIPVSLGKPRPIYTNYLGVNGLLNHSVKVECDKSYIFSVTIN